MGTPESGKDGTVKLATVAVALITKWTLTKIVATDRFATNESAGFKETIRGVRSATGTIEGKWNSAAASTVADNLSVTLQLHLNATELYSVPAVMRSFVVGPVDIDDGKVTPFTAEFESNGAWTEPTLA